MSVRNYVRPADQAYRDALGVTTLPNVIGTISHGGTASSRKRAAKSSYFRNKLDNAPEVTRVAH